MKKIIIFLVLVSLISIAFFEYKNYKKFNPPNQYDYAVKSTEIDLDYHNPHLVAMYFEKAYQIGTFARQTWYNENIDVLYVNQATPRSQSATATYNHLLVLVKQLEAKLTESKRLKGLGFDNKAIKYIEENGISEKQYQLHQLFEGQILKAGDEGKNVWELQRLLIKKGFNMKLDGKFSEETKAILQQFQQNQKLYPSGIADNETLDLLIQ